MHSSSTDSQSIWHIAVPTPLHTGFDYLGPVHTPPPAAGVRVRVPFGRRLAIGILLEIKQQAAVEQKKLKPILNLIDVNPVLPPDLLALGRWASDYYHHPIGAVLHHMLPALVRQGLPAVAHTESIWRVAAAGKDLDPASLQRAPKQQALLVTLQQNPAGLAAEVLDAGHANWRPAMQALCDKGWAERASLAPVNTPRTVVQPAFDLNPDQQQALNAVCSNLNGFNRWLLEGVTGSGKTEVYLGIIEQVLALGRQALVLVPEIGLTPQLLQRFSSRLSVPITVIHSHLSDRQRLNAWLSAASGEARVIIGTRSAIFIPLARPGAIIIDEEHDGSFKQNDGFRYHARDLAIVRAQHLDIPVVMGSATPSLESLLNVQQARYQRLHLPVRTGPAQLPHITVLDARNTPAGQAISSPLQQRVRQHLAAGNQVLIFLNRRGYAPIYMCRACGWSADCQRCDAHMTVHRVRDLLCCHHCGAERPLPRNCPDCNLAELFVLGLGTEQVEEYFQEHFPDYKSVRIDRDTTRRKGQLEQSLQLAHSGTARILIGTQMLAKGHHFPQVTLVGILGIDQALFSADFRGPEYMAQLVTQVSGRAGRAERAGEVLIESRQPQHPLLHALITRGYRAFADAALAERQAAQLPPYTRMALIRAEAVSAQHALGFLAALRTQLQSNMQGSPILLLGPAPAPMERRAGRYRAHLLLQANQPRVLHSALQCVPVLVAGLPQRKSVRWSIDVDPSEMF
jgi:primosomal protein N' (replication factor Y)